MAMQTAAAQTEIIYPKRTATDGAKHQTSRRMMTLKENLDALFADRDDVFVAMTLLVPVKDTPNPPSARCDGGGRPKRIGVVQAVGRGNIPPQVVFEVVSPATPGGVGREVGVL
jgi:hypothetical protein